MFVLARLNAGFITLTLLDVRILAMIGSEDVDLGEYVKNRINLFGL